MKHGNANRKFGRVRRQRKALISGLARSLILHERIETTEAKAKELRPFIEKLITTGSKQTVAARRDILSKITDKEAVKKLVDTIAPKYKERQGGYTRIIKLPQRAGDAAKIAVIEFV